MFCELLFCVLVPTSHSSDGSETTRENATRHTLKSDRSIFLRKKNENPATPKQQTEEASSPSVVSDIVDLHRSTHICLL